MENNKKFYKVDFKEYFNEKKMSKLTKINGPNNIKYCYNLDIYSENLNLSMFLSYLWSLKAE